VVDSLRREEISKRLMRLVFTHEDLGQVPVTWGRSYETLKRRMTPVVTLDLAKASLHDIEHKGEWLSATGKSPYLETSLDGSDISGKKAGLLYFEFECKAGKPHDCLFTVGWWAEGRKSPEESQSLTFKARSGRIIVPLDSHPDWLMTDRVGGIRITLPEKSHCQTMRIGNASLQQRVMTKDPAGK
jgi:hypothetical protein